MPAWSLRTVAQPGIAARHGLRPRKLPISALAMPGKRAWTELVARGVVGVIAPWNYPLGVFFKPVLPAPLCGNSVVLKPSEYTPRTGAAFAAMLSQVLPRDVITVVQGGRDIGRGLVAAGVDAVSFTGSPQGGRAVLTACAERLIPCSVELGGKDPAIVLPDCDLERTALGILNWSLHNAGQDCAASSASTCSTRSPIGSSRSSPAPPRASSSPGAPPRRPTPAWARSPTRCSSPSSRSTSRTRSTRERAFFVDTNTAPDPWWLPADALLAEMAERLARVQLGAFTAALKLPGVMSARKKSLLALVRLKPDARPVIRS